MGLASEILSDFGVFSSGFISAFFQEAGKVEVEKEQLHMDVSMGVTVGDTTLSICCDIASWPMLLAISCCIAV